MKDESERRLGMVRSAQTVKILSYHSVTADARGSKWRVPLTHFRAQLQYLVDSAIPVLPLIEAARHLRTGECPPRAVVLTFDDGYLDNYQYILPVLRSLHLPATLFVLAGRAVGSGGSQDPSDDLPRMGWPQVREWIRAGLEVGVHGMHHLELPGLSDARLETELVTAREIIAERIGSDPSPTFAYPYALSDKRVRDATRAAGYACAVGGSSPRACTARTESFALRRETVYGDTPLWAFAAKMNPRWDSPRLLWDVPARGAIRIARRLLPLSRAGVMSVPSCEPKP